jgi:tryptophan synthase beta chain
MSPIFSQLYYDGYIKAIAYTQNEVFEAAQMFTRCENTLPAPESAHAIKAGIDQAIRCRENGEDKIILIGLSGTGYFDMAAYAGYNAGTLKDSIPTDAQLEVGFSTLPKIGG